MKKRLKWTAAWLVFGAVLWVPMASVAMAFMLNSLRKIDSWVLPFAGFYYWRDYGHQPAVARLLGMCFGGAALVAIVPAFCALCWPENTRQRIRSSRRGEVPPPARRAFSDLHGHADWMPLAGLLKVANRPLRNHGGVVYGTACRADINPDQDGGNAPLLVDPCEEDATHGLVLIGSGGGKTSGYVVPTLDPEAGWRANVLVNDPSSQAGAMCAKMRRDAGQRVYMLGFKRSPVDIDQTPRVGFNVFGWIDPADPLFEEHVKAAIQSISTETSKAKQADNPNAMFKEQGTSLQECLLADMLSDPSTSRADKTPRRLAVLAATPEHRMKGLLQTIHEESNSELARLLAGSLMEAPAKTFSGFCVEATANLKWLMTKTYADLVSGTASGSLTTDAFTFGNACIFLQLGVKTMEDTPQIGRAILTALLNAIYREEGRTKKRYLLLLDEINLFGKLQALSTASSQGRKYGITIVGFWHSISQMETTCGQDGAETWRANAAWEAFSAMNPATAKAVSERCGTYTAIAQTEGRNTSNQSGMSSGSRSRGTNDGTSLQARNLINKDEVERLLRKDEVIVFKRGETAPIRAIKAYYYRRPTMAAKVNQDQFRIAAE